MYYEFYLDVYFLENLVMNVFVLWMTGILWKERCKTGRLLGMAAVGAACACAAAGLHWYRGPWQELILNAVMELGMLAGVYKNAGLNRWMYRAVTFRLLSLLVEGSWQILRRFLHVPVPFSMAAGILLLFFLLRQVGKSRNHRQFLYSVTISRRGRQQNLTALWDSGNQLTQPLTGRPVHIVDYEAVRELLTEQEQEELKLLLNLQTVRAPIGVFTLIPYHSIGRERGLLPVLKLDEIRIEKENEIWNMPDRLAAVSKMPVSQNGLYQMILHP